VDGFAHSQHPDGDRRTPTLIALAGESGVAGHDTEILLAMESGPCGRKGRRIPLNAGGAIAATFLASGLS
jgi:hypothetical protein